ncbi:hypothetical protein C2G38_2048267 [Gigaspora rosea]|uniref:Uncharacterized protein n=1 Tax=Gigaspora rosea TaxID=44941 RepID=A0A397U7C0_9GLOM|nr:hypothetical protein C2G38_2048267 [Gigaspora rosea]
MKEESNYPQSSFIKLFDKNRTFYYEIIKEGTYPPSNQCYYTKYSKHPIPNNYIVKTQHGKAKHLTKCSIQYKNKKPQFTIQFGLNFASKVQYFKSATDAVCQYYKELNKIKAGTNTKRANMNNKISKISGPLLFGLTLLSVKNIRQTLPLDYNSKFHLFEDLSVSTKRHKFEIGDEQFDIYFGKFDEKSENERKEAIVKLLDCGRITREAYRSLARIEHEISHEDLQLLQENGFQQLNSNRWPVRLYFGSDWKFLATCLGMKAANAKHFCLWYNCTKANIGDTNKQITKTIEMVKINYSKINGHLNKPLFYMIPLYNWVCDELHVFLRITDRLWELMLSDLSREQVEETIWQAKILDEMKQLIVAFQFWNEKNNNNLLYTLLMGPDKLKVLQKFNLTEVF